jgi:hypothetical protein
MHGGWVVLLWQVSTSNYKDGESGVFAIGGVAYVAMRRKQTFNPLLVLQKGLA